MKHTLAFNPYLPSWEYIPDGEPYVFGDRVYVYGSHDRAGGMVFCMNDYVCWSAPVEDPGDWRYEGVIFRKTDDPLNPDGHMCLYAPDVTRGPDGRYYLYYALDKDCVVSVAVCDTPAGKFSFLGYVHYPDGTPLGKKPEDEYHFDPGVLTEGEYTYLYTGFCPPGEKKRHGPMVTVLESDMLTVHTAPVFVLPSEPYAKGTAFEHHEYFEAPSIRKIGSLYYLVYSSVVQHELCYAVSSYPDHGFEFGGVIVSNNDTGISSYKPAEKPMYYGANNHGGMVQINGQWYIFYHRQTHGTNFSRQGMAEPITIRSDGHIDQVEMTSCGLNGGPLPGVGTYPAHIACNLFCPSMNGYTGGVYPNGFWLDGEHPRILQDGSDGEEVPGYIMNLRDGTGCGFKYFEFRGLKSIRLNVRGYFDGYFEVRTQWDGPCLGTIPVVFHNIWTEHEAPVSIPDGVHALYFTFRGHGAGALLSFTLVS